MGDNMEHFVSDNIQLMVIDNDQAFLKEARMMFSSCNYRVTTCASPLYALKILRERRAEFNLLLVEVHMQEMGGFELISMIKNEFDLHFIMISADVRLEIMKKSIELGACFFVKKPLDINTVENLWQHVLSFKKHSKRESIESTGDREFHYSDQASTLNEEEENMVETKEKEDDTPKQEANKECTECSKDTIEGEQKMESEDDNLSKLKKKPISWCSFLQQKFLNALEILGDDAVPSKIMRLMNVEGISRQQIASHLQKYRKKKGSNNTFTPIYFAQNIQGGNFINQIPNQFGQHGLHQTYLSNYNQQYLQGVVTQITPVYAQIPLSFNIYPYANVCYERSYLENVQLNGYATSNPTQALQQFEMSQPPIHASTIGELSTQPMAYETTNDTFHYGGQTFQDRAPNYDSVANKGEFSSHESPTCEVGQQYYYGNISNNDNNMKENFQKVVDNDDFGDIEKFAYGDDPWLSILQDVTEGDLDLDISSDV